MHAILLSGLLASQLAGAPDYQSSTAPAGRAFVVGIQVHGNVLTTDDEIRRLASVEIGAPFDETTIAQVTARLRQSRRFERVEVLKRFASIADPSQILLVIVVDEGPVRIDITGDPERPIEVVRNRRLAPMFLPVLYAEDGYGVTYGARVGWARPVGKESRLALPLTWGGDKRAAVEFEKTVDNGFFDHVQASGAVWRRTNPYYEADDTRERVWVRGERSLTRWLRAGATAGWQHVSFLGATDQFAHAGADVSLDTRVDPVLPRNAVFARAAWEHVAGANRFDLDAQGYVGLFRQNILALRLQQSAADRSLPPFLKPLLGGIANLRGFKAGSSVGDELLVTSAEVIVPLTSPTRIGRMGVSGFVDTGTAYDYGQRLADQPWKTGVGGSVWFSAAFLRLNFAVAHGLGSSTHAHIGANVTF
jgi:outer membrane protein assembly factor BamA